MCSDEEPKQMMSNFAILRRRLARKCLVNIDVSKCTGPDDIPGVVLKRCAKVLDIAFVILARRMLLRGVWPDCWRLHWVCPIFKKGAVARPGNYRGVHLTAVGAKIIERILGDSFVGFLDRTGAVGINQWAYRPKHSCRDLLALLVASWILILESGHWFVLQ